MRGLLLLIVVSVLTFTRPAFTAYPVPEERDLEKEIKKLQSAIEVMEQERARLVSKYLDHDASIQGASYQEYARDRSHRQNRLSRQELESEIHRMTHQQMNHVAEKLGIKLPTEHEEADDAFGSTYQEAESATGYGDTYRRKPHSKAQSTDSASAYSSTKQRGEDYPYWHTRWFNSDMSSRYQDFFREYEELLREKRTDDILYGGQKLEEYTVEIPERLTDRPTQRAKVRVNPGKMKLLKEKHALDQLLIDDVLRMTGKLPGRGKGQR